MGIPESFTTLLGRIQQSSAEREAIQKHIEVVKTRIDTDFEVDKFMVVGSFSRGSSISGYSDGDLFVVLTRDAVRWGNGYITSNTALDRFKTSLEKRFPASDVFRDVQAVVVQFSDSHVDAVPAYFSRFAKLDTKNWPIYAMPDGAGGWMETAPDLHNAWIQQEDNASGGKLKYTATLAKFWRQCRSPAIPISSFYIEMVLADEGICKGAKGYAECLTELFQALARRECRAMRDPFGVCGYIQCANTPSKVAACLDAAIYARDHAKSALAAPDLATARYQWDLVFNGNFPYC